jgi:hypothetical protein
MQYIYAITRLWRVDNNTKETMELITKIQKCLIDSAHDEAESLLTLDLNKIELSILNSVSQGLASDKIESWDSSRELITSAFKQLK